MARIRTIKPDFFRHELLQDLDLKHQGSCCMLVFAGLWGHCDKSGRFRWRPRHLKLDILPFLHFEMQDTLSLLESAGQIVRYSVDGDDYGWIPTFTDHQRISGKESQDPDRYPAPPSDVVLKHGSNREASGKLQGRQEGKGRELGKEGNRSASASPVDKSTSKPNGNGAWWKTEAGIKAKGEELKIPANAGESWAAYKDRLFQHLGTQG